MICLILAGGRGERLWPLSRKNYPKQFIQIQKNHSLFQETIARNMPVCDEFVIVTDYEYRFIIENQMQVFQGVTYRCIYEKEAGGTGPAITLASMEYQPSEIICVVPADHLIETGSAYQDAIVSAKKMCIDGKIVLFCKDLENSDSDNDNCVYDGTQVLKYDVSSATYEFADKQYRNTGIMMFENGVFQKHLQKNDLYTSLSELFLNREETNSNVISNENFLSANHRISIDRMLRWNDELVFFKITFTLEDVGKLDDLVLTEYEGKGIVIADNSDSIAINESGKQALVLDHVDDLLVVNTTDAIYVGKKGKSADIKALLSEHPQLKNYSDHGTTFYRSWGYYEQLIETVGYRVRKLVLYSGKTIYSHIHEHRKENWTIVEGGVSVLLGDKLAAYGPGDNIDIPVNTEHQLSNVGNREAVIIEVSFGDIISEDDMIGRSVSDLTETQLGIEIEPFIKLLPSFRDYLWGGTKLRDLFNKKCDFDLIAESWELSAHPSGQSIVASGRHKGLLFGDYISTVGKEVLGWKCQSLPEFPILVKLIDAKDDLSVQVHPNDEYALEFEHQHGKTEMWYVVDSVPGSVLYIGFNKNITKEEVEERLKTNTITEVLNRIITKPGDVFFIPPGVVHAIGKGNMIYELQQNSNCTYRLHDYGRVDKYGNSRELHLGKALDVIDYTKYSIEGNNHDLLTDHHLLSRCKYFEASVYKIKNKKAINLDNSSFLSIVCLKGSGYISKETDKLFLDSGDSVFVKAQDSSIILEGNMTVVIAKV